LLSLTAFKPGNWSSKRADAGALAYSSKPFRDELVPAIELAIGRSRARRVSRGERELAGADRDRASSSIGEGKLNGRARLRDRRRSLHPEAGDERRNRMPRVAERVLAVN